MELYKELRPANLDEMIGCHAAVASLRNMLAKGTVPQAILFTGPSGCGKTTLGRILKTELGCHDGDFYEMNAADSRGIDTIREIRAAMTRASLAGGSCRIWMLDEAALLTKDAQSALLKMLEDTPPNVYFFLCTTDPAKLLPTVKKRCTEFQCRSFSATEMQQLVTNGCEHLGITISDAVTNKLIELADGSARYALVLLDLIGNLPEGDRLAALEKAVGAEAGIEVARCLFSKQPSWKEMSELLKNLTEEPETVRWICVSYASSVLLGPTTFLHNKALQVIDEMRDSFFDTKKAGLVRACYAIIMGK